MSGLVSVGTLARSLWLRSDNARLNSDLTTLAKEMASGQKVMTSAERARTAPTLSSLERALTTGESQRMVLDEARLALDTSQSALGQIDAEMEGLFSGLLAIHDEGGAQLAAVAADARTRFSTVTSLLNTSVAGRSLFAGADFDGPAVASGQSMLDELGAIVAAETTAGGVRDAVRAWFAEGGGFDAAGYLGADLDAVPVRLGASGDAVAAVRADDPGLRDALAGMALGALVDTSALAGNPGERSALARLAAESIHSARGGLTEMRARLGSSEEKLDRAASRGEAERSANLIARSEMLAADPYETATRLQTVEQQLQGLYTITGRLSSLNLTNFLK